jgi:hypothetical protein
VKSLAPSDSCDSDGGKKVEFRAPARTQRHDVKPGIIPERLWRKLYIRGMTPQAADQAAVSANNTISPTDRLKQLKR